MEEVKNELEEELRRWQLHLGPENVKFYHYGKKPCQLEVPATSLHLEEN